MSKVFSYDVGKKRIPSQSLHEAWLTVANSYAKNIGNNRSE